MNTNTLTPAEVARLDPGMNILDAIVANTMETREFDTYHTFTPGLYSRRIFMPAGSMVNSKIHRTRHQFTVLQGAALVRDNDGEWILIQAPHHGITEPGTRRSLFILMDMVWITFHPTLEGEETVEQVEARIIEPHAIFRQQALS
jgi:hypothetical protein